MFSGRGPAADPDRYKKWRKSTYSVPETRIIHPGGVDDWRGVKHPEFFGVRKKDPGRDEARRRCAGAAGAESEYAQTKLTQAERHYHSTRMEPLGKCFSHGHVLPEECRTESTSSASPRSRPAGTTQNFDLYAVRETRAGRTGPVHQEPWELRSRGTAVPRL